MAVQVEGAGGREIAKWGRARVLLILLFYLFFLLLLETKFKLSFYSA
jgi:hypothetical protein